MFELIQSSNPQRRGYLLEKMIKELFDLFDLDPKASFKVLGEQIDGAFTFDNTDYLLEAKWEKSPLSLEPLYAFSMKVKNKLDNTLGLFIAINGFSAEAITKLSGGNCNIILMDGSDLMAVLEQQIKLPELLLRKRRHAAQTGNAFLTFRDF